MWQDLLNIPLERLEKYRWQKVRKSDGEVIRSRHNQWLKAEYNLNSIPWLIIIWLELIKNLKHPQ